MSKQHKLVIPENPHKSLFHMVAKYSRWDGKVLPDDIAKCVIDDGLGEWLQEIKEPVIYPALEIAKKCLETDGRGGSPSAFAIALVCEGDKNGRLREWMRPEQVELREAVEDYTALCALCVSDEFFRMKNALENLKPPYKIEE
jgi:hypothetical protein